MSFKKVISLLLVVFMTASLAFSMVACQEEDANNARINHLPDQLENQRYYFQQGYTKETWDVAIGENDYYLRRIQQTANGDPVRVSSVGLCAQFTPKGRTDITYSIYNIAGVGGAAVTRGVVFEQLVNDEISSNFHFNELFLDSTEQDGRENFVMDKYEDVNDTIVNIDKTQFNTLGYTFTKEGIDWKGNLYFIPHQMGGITSFHVITVETVASVWDELKADIDIMLKDFKQIGYEKKGE